jgi:acetylornithine/succinyldiaminopimelate/putrescine aminotransferase
MDKLNKLKTDFPSVIIEIRGSGLMVGLELTIAGNKIVDACANRGILINCTSGNVLRFTPPLIINEKEVDHLIDILDDVLERQSY